MSKFISLSAGHGGTDSGAVGNGYKERDLTMELVKLIEKHLKAKYTGFTIKTQQEKTSNGVFRSSTAYGTQSGFYMSVHFNSNAGTAGNGTEILQGNYGSSRCNKVNKVLAKYFYNRGIKQIDTSQFYMLRECGFDMIAEICFINNSSDMKKYQENKNKIAEELADAIAESEGLSRLNTTPHTTHTTRYAKVYKECVGYYNHCMQITNGGATIWKDSNCTKSTGNKLRDFKVPYVNARFVKTITKDGEKWWVHEFLNDNGDKRYYCYRRDY